jgi:hypothetical protein
MPSVTIEFSGPKEEVEAFLESLFETNSVNTGTEKHLSGGAGTFTMGRALVRKSVGAPRMIEVILSVGHDLHEVALGVIGAYLYDKLKGHKGEKPKMTIDSQEIQLDKGEIIKIIETEIKLNEDD